MRRHRRAAGALRATGVPAAGALLFPRVADLLDAVLVELQRGESLPDADKGSVWTALVTLVMREAVSASAQPFGLEPRGGRLFSGRMAPGGEGGVATILAKWNEPLRDVLSPLRDAAAAAAAEGGDPPVELVGALHESLVAHGVVGDLGGAPRIDRTHRRKQRGSYYTPASLTREVVQRALEAQLPRSIDGQPDRAAALLDLRICDPALGAGAFLVEVTRQLGQAIREAAPAKYSLAAARRAVATRCLFGVDLDPLAVAVAEAVLWLLVAEPGLELDRVGAGLRQGNALLGMTYADVEPAAGLARPALPRGLAAFHWPLELAPAGEARGFDVVLGNPPWVAFAGRAAQPLAAHLRKYYATRFTAWRGYPTLHGLFVERAAALAPQGTIALIVPSPLADLDGYRGVRLALTRTHCVQEPLLELGQDAFVEVVQPCIVLVASSSPEASETDRCWQITERQRAESTPCEVEVPAVLELLSRAPSLPVEVFREMGFQTTRIVSQSLLRRGSVQDANHPTPLLEGKNVREFFVGPPGLFLDSAEERLRRAGARLRPVEAYARVDFVVRQTASIPIAALHSGLPFRNTLLAGFATPELDRDLLVGLLNSALYRALHLAARRDARQAVFPQVKVGHLRRLPEPPALAPELGLVRAISRELSASARAGEGQAPRELREQLDAAVFDLFGLLPQHRAAVLAFLATRLRSLGYEAPAKIPLRADVTSLQPVAARLGLA